jgi:SAM-dependent methyltransferase
MQPAAATTISYETLEKLSVPSPVDRLAYIADACRGRRVLDIGCLDETALAKRDTEYWLHGRIAAVASRVIGVDTSLHIPDEGLVTAASAVIYRGDGTDPHLPGLDDSQIDVIVAGEFIEHIELPVAFIVTMRKRFAGRELLLSTPNGLAFGNTLAGLFRREAQHPDHLHLFTYKIINTLCLRAGLSDYKIIPYRFYATELLLASGGAKRLAVRAVEQGVRLMERIAPQLSFGYILRAKL